MPPSSQPRRIALAALGALAATISTGAQAQSGGGVTLLKVVGPRDEVTIGFTEAELAALGAGGGPAVERVARALVAQGQVTAWQYVVGRAPDGSTRYATTRKVAVMRNEALRIEPYAASLPVAPPPAQ